MLSAKIKDIKYRILFSKIEKKRLLLKFLFFNLLGNKNKKNRLVISYIFLKLNFYSKLSFKTKTKIVRRCAVTARGRGVFRPYNVSRFVLREYTQFGLLPGYKKAVW